MAKFDRYILAQLTMVFGFFALVLVLIYWINRAVALFDQLIANGQSATVFFEFTALSLPNVIRLVLPIAAFAASVYVANRLTAESELVVVQATGFSPFRMVQPVLVFGVLVGLLILLLTHVLVPKSITQFNTRQAEISENITARLLTEGSFLHPAAGVTFYIREISADGQLQDIYLSDHRNTDRRVTYTAKRALLIRQDSGPKLVMFEGMAQQLTADGQRLSITRFDDFAYDISGLVDNFQVTGRGIKELTTAELFNPTEALMTETGASRDGLIYEGHNRINQAVSALVTALVGFSAILLGSFSRFGRWRQILGALAALAVLKTLDNAFADMARRDADLWFLTYTASIIGIALTFAILWLSARPALFARLRRLRGAPG